ncbi:hypothetical protein [Fibrobacter sp.]|uniref:hypothetical protein n=1 Tax=Fibrobacter sp. TaxID=35828 RepID=UPI00386B9C2E
MISPTFATIIIISFILLFGVGIPVLNVKAEKFISYRWCVVVVVLAMLIGAVVDFETLSDEVRHTVILGGIIVAGVYIGLRTVEKVLSKGWLAGTTLKARKGDAEVELSSEGKKDENLH